MAENSAWEERCGLNGYATVALSGRHELYPTMTVLIVIPVDEFADPFSRRIQALKGF